jgi:hypothetical protein
MSPFVGRGDIIKDYAERSMIRPQNVNKGKLNKFTLKARMSSTYANILKYQKASMDTVR